MVFENPGEGTDAVFSTVSYSLSANVETLVLQGAGNLSGTGNGAAWQLRQQPTQWSRRRRCARGPRGQRRHLVFRAGEANGDTVVDFTGNGASAGDSLTFVGFDTIGQGASFTQIGATDQWQIHSGLDSHNEIIKFMNGATIHLTDFLFS